MQSVTEMVQPRIKPLEQALIDSCWGRTAELVRSDVRKDSAQTGLFGLVGALDFPVRQMLTELNLERKAVIALVFMPMLDVLWRSSATHERKGQALNRVTTQLGLRENDAGYVMLNACARERRCADCLKQWQALVHALVPMLDIESLSALQSELMDRAWQMAAALHGENAMYWPKSVFAALSEIEQTFYEV